MAPIYEYECPEGHLHERQVPVEALTHDLRQCPECGADARRIISMPQRPVVKDGTPTHFKHRRG